MPRQVGDEARSARPSRLISFPSSSTPVGRPTAAVSLSQLYLADRPADCQCLNYGAGERESGVLE